jgi:serine/threonine-protein kinase
MASIFKARDGFSGVTVALKIPHVQFESDIVFSQRFEREEKIMQKLDHPAVIRILKPREKSRMYLAMEFVEGRSLRAIMRGKPLPTEQALDLAKQVCEALVYLESLGVVHRDLKPENVIVQPDGKVKILDFGIAMAESSRRLTWGALSNAIGTPDYMAPEQIKGKRGDARTDVYALGMLLYEMLTGKLPWDGTNPAALLRAKANDEPRPPSYHVPGFDPALESIILRSIEKEPRFRYASAAELLTDLQNPAGAALRDPETGARRQQAAKRSRRRAVAVGVVVAVLGGLVVLIWLSADGTPPPAPGKAGTTLERR